MEEVIERSTWNAARAIKQEQLSQKIDLQNLQGLSKKVHGLEEDVIAIGADVRKLQKLLEGGQAPGIGGTEHKSFSPPIASNVGRVMLTNLYGERMLFVVNGRSYAVDPGAVTQLYNMPVGPMTYEVFGDGYDKRTGAIQDYFTRVLELIQTPPKLDVEAFLRDRATAAPEDYEDGDSILARLKAGGDL